MRESDLASDFESSPIAVTTESSRNIFSVDCIPRWRTPNNVNISSKLSIEHTNNIIQNKMINKIVNHFSMFYHYYLWKIPIYDLQMKVHLVENDQRSHPSLKYQLIMDLWFPQNTIPFAKQMVPHDRFFEWFVSDQTYNQLDI